ncbi:heme-copper oxidase subunit III [Egibacter rhizosphaerae]|uniref:cytochrome-c oxidase n=2 Tax=Egibacter rhizosphaerae TaxID=1670831 RepID=A0A411YKV6_9ACTN|nr:heme-copper oxidase subunit III [Egibacter rhizosphaerae]
MWVFLASECLFFGAFVAAYLIYMTSYGDSPEINPGTIYDIPFTSVSTFVLLMSSLGIVLALTGAQRGDERMMRTWLLATALMGAIFLSGQIYEFTVFIEEGMTLSTSPFTTSFYVLTGFHGVHVTVGVLMLLILWSRSLMGKLNHRRSEIVENVGLYWHFVDIVWIVIFTLIYLVPVE